MIVQSFTIIRRVFLLLFYYFLASNFKITFSRHTLLLGKTTLQLGIKFCSLEFWDAEKPFHGYGNKFISNIFITENIISSAESCQKLGRLFLRRWVEDEIYS